MATTCKISHLINVGTSGYLNKYLFKKKKCNNIFFREVDSEYIYAKNIENEKILNSLLE
jgi:hypothetical protein